MIAENLYMYEIEPSTHKEGHFTIWHIGNCRTYVMTCEGNLRAEYIVEVLRTVGPDKCIQDPTEEPDPGGHIAIHHIQCDSLTCWFCEGGLWGCTRCMGLEGGMPTECPGDMTSEQLDLVHKGELDFRGGKWREETSRFSPGGRDERSLMYMDGRLSENSGKSTWELGQCPPGSTNLHAVPCVCER